ncbi:MAG: DNA polymerase, partial [Candidatus Dormibacteraceae bacterium]
CDIGHRVADTMLASQLLDAGLPGAHAKGRHTLQALTKRVLGVELDKTEQASDWSRELRQEQLRYAARDAAVLLPLARRLDQELEEAGLTRVVEIECRALPALAWLEDTGVQIDRDRWLRLAERAWARKAEVEACLDNVIGSHTTAELGFEVERGVVDWNSRDTVLALLRERGVELPNLKRDTLAEHVDDDPLVAVLLERSEWTGRTTVFGERFLERVHPLTGRLHGDFKQAFTASGRISCEKPNLQNIPRDLAYRACFRAPEGRLLVKCDYSQIELRIAAEIAQDERMMTAYREQADLHQLTARTVLGKSEVSKADRQAGKATNFGLCYGMGPIRFRANALANYGVEFTEKEARRFRATFFQTYRGLAAWHARYASQREAPIDTRTLAGRRRLSVINFSEKLNTPVQGTGADGLKLAMGLLFETRDRVPSAKPVLNVHDEIVLECDERDAAEAEVWLGEVMRGGMQQLLRRVPVEVESSRGRDWSMREEAGDAEHVA